MAYGGTTYGAGLYGGQTPSQPLGYEAPAESNYGSDHMSTTNLDVANAALMKLGADPITSLSENSNRAKAMTARIEWCKWALLRMHHWNFAIKRVTLSLTDITGAADNGSGLIRITAADHGYSTGDYVGITDVVGTTEANGKWTVSVINSSTFDLDSSTYANGYTSGGLTGFAAAYDYDWAFSVPSDFLRLKSVGEAGYSSEMRLEDTKIVTDVQPIKLQYIANVTNYGIMDVLFRECLALYLAWDTCIRITQSEGLKTQLWEDFKLILPKTRFVDSTEDSLQTIQADEFVRSRFGHNIGYVSNNPNNPLA